MRIGAVTVFLAVGFFLNGQVFAVSSGEEKVQLLGELIKKAERELGVNVHKRPIYYKDVSIEPNSKLDYSPFRSSRDEKIVIYKNSITYLWSYSEPGNPHYWYRYNSVSSFLQGYFKDPIRIQATNYSRMYYDHSSLKAMGESAEFVATAKKQYRSQLEEKLREIGNSELAIKVQNVIFR
jgi:hypothetical protein